MAFVSDCEEELASFCSGMGRDELSSFIAPLAYHVWCLSVRNRIWRETKSGD